MSTPPPPSPFSPLRHTIFRWLFIANAASNVGTWVHDVGAGWLMTTLAPTAVMVALVQAATSFPLFLFALPAGALADVVDRRRLLLGAQTLMAVVAASLAAAVFLTGGHISPWLLLVMTLALGIGAALTNPAWQAGMTELVPPEELHATVALNSVSMNLSRAVGPAIGGLIVSIAGPGAAFAFNALSFIGIIAALYRWPYRRPATTVPPERFTGAMRAGVRYIRHSPPLRAVLVRTASFILFASSIWALLPLVAHQQLGLKASGYGLLLSCLGAGALGATALLQRLRAGFSANELVIVASVLYAAALLILGSTDNTAVACPAMALAGAGWVIMVVCLNTAAQTGAPAWVRARALACYIAVFYAGMAAGSTIWGFVATHTSLGTALIASAAGMILGLASLPWFRIHASAIEEHSPSRHWAQPGLAAPVTEDAGPVVVTVEYHIDPADFAAFADAMDPVRRTRYRDGATTWLLTQDTADPTRWVEIFTVDSWAEHLRQHDRVTVADRRLQVRATAFHRGPGRPIVSHLVAAPLPAAIAIPASPMT
jgi:MFS family permease